MIELPLQRYEHPSSFNHKLCPIDDKLGPNSVCNSLDVMVLEAVYMQTLMKLDDALKRIDSLNKINGELHEELGFFSELSPGRRLTSSI